jgi:hypothetical protein
LALHLVCEIQVRVVVHDGREGVKC